MSHLATRSIPFPVDSSHQIPFQKVEQKENEDDCEDPINLTSIIDTLLKDEE